MIAYTHTISHAHKRRGRASESRPYKGGGKPNVKLTLCTASSLYLFNPVRVCLVLLKTRTFFGHPQTRHETPTRHETTYFGQSTPWPRTQRNLWCSAIFKAMHFNAPSITDINPTRNNMKNITRSALNPTWSHKRNVKQRLLDPSLHWGPQIPPQFHPTRNTPDMKQRHLWGDFKLQQLSRVRARDVPATCSKNAVSCGVWFHRGFVVLWFLRGFDSIFDPDCSGLVTGSLIPLSLLLLGFPCYFPFAIFLAFWGGGGGAFFLSFPSRNRKRCRQTGSRQSTPLSTIRTRYGNSASAPGATRTGKNKQNSLQKGSRYGISVSTPTSSIRTPIADAIFAAISDSYSKDLGGSVRRRILFSGISLLASLPRNNAQQQGREMFALGGGHTWTFLTIPFAKLRGNVVRTFLRKSDFYWPLMLLAEQWQCSLYANVLFVQSSVPTMFLHFLQMDVLQTDGSRLFRCTNAKPPPEISSRER